jgi:hypothetical protein
VEDDEYEEEEDIEDEEAVEWNIVTMFSKF